MASGMLCDVAVIGAGIEGSCTALTLAKQSKKVFLIEQFSLPHTRGSSHGQTRLIRTGYCEDFFTKMMGDAFDLWKVIENESGKDIICNTGMLVCAKPPFDEFECIEKNLATFCPKNLESLSVDDVRKRFPMMKFNDDMKCLVDKSGGVVKANVALQTIQNLFCKYGGKILDGCPVTDIQAYSDKVVLTAGGTTVTASAVVICCGPWANKVLKLTDLQLPLQPQRVEVFYFKEKNVGQFTLEGKFPSFLYLNYTEAHVYGLTAIEYPSLVKICIHHGINCDPDERDRCTITDDDKNLLNSLIECHFPDLEPVPAVVETCMYTETPDDSFILDRHPRYQNIIIGAGFSGSGFKIAPVVGKILADLASGIEPNYDMKHFSINRFT